MDKPREFKDYDKKGKLYATDYGVYDIPYNNVSEFINDISDKEMSLAIQDCKITGENVEEDPLYKKYKRLKNTQMISQNELNSLFEAYHYDFVSNFKSEA